MANVLSVQPFVELTSVCGGATIGLTVCERRAEGQRLGERRGRGGLKA